jgi:hypothetical protein
MAPRSKYSRTATKTPVKQLEREITEALTHPEGARASALRPRRGLDLTGELVRTMPRFEFIAHWLAVVTKKKENRGPLGLYVRHVGKKWQVVSPIAGGTVTYETNDPALLFDYARRGQLGSEIRNADEFRALAYEIQFPVAACGPCTPTQSVAVGVVLSKKEDRP